jgi:hypothetical protein
MLGAGVLHLIVAPGHIEHAPAHGLFFIITGVLQIAWAILFWRSGSQALSKLGFVMALWLVLLWAVTRFFFAPFGHGPEEVDVSGLATKACEVICAIALALLLVSTAAATGASSRRAWRTVIALVVAAVLVTALTYGVARAAEPYLPGLTAPEAHEHEEAPGVEHEHDAEQPHEHEDEATPADTHEQVTEEPHEHEHVATPTGGTEHEHEHEATPTE